MTAVIAVTSGTPRVGKSTLSANLAHYLNSIGHRTGLLEAGSRSRRWNIQPISTWTNILNGRIALEELIYRNRFGVDLMVTQDHGHALAGISEQAQERVAGAIQALDAYTYLIVDMASGLRGPAIAGCLAATETLLVITPDTPSLTAAYEWLVRLSRHGFSGPVNLVLNQVKKPALAQSVFIRFRDLAQKRLNLQTNLWGTMSEENGLQPDENPERPLSKILPQAKLVSDIHMIGDRLVAEQPPENQTQPLDIIWHQFIDGLRVLPVMPVARRQPEEPSEKEETHDDAAASAASQAVILPPFDLSEALNNMTQQLSAIATELDGIRRLLETRSPKADSTAQQEKEEPVDGLELDFDAFVATRLKSE